MVDIVLNGNKDDIIYMTVFMLMQFYMYYER